MQTFANASPSLPYLPYITFLTADNALLFWQYVRAMLFVVMPLLMIFMATAFAGKFITTIRKAFSNDSDGIKPVKERDYDIKIKS